MECLYCGGILRVTNSRPQRRSNQIWRRRRCEQCLATFTSHEALDMSAALMVEGKNGPPEAFLVDKLFTEVLLALQDRKRAYSEAREITATVVSSLLKLSDGPQLSRQEISRLTAAVLKRFDKQAWRRYQAEHPSLL